MMLEAAELEAAGDSSGKVKSPTMFRAQNKRHSKDKMMMLKELKNINEELGHGHGGGHGGGHGHEGHDPIEGDKALAAMRRVSGGVMEGVGGMLNKVPGTGMTGDTFQKMNIGGVVSLLGGGTNTSNEGTPNTPKKQFLTMAGNAKIHTHTDGNASTGGADDHGSHAVALENAGEEQLIKFNEALDAGKQKVTKINLEHVYLFKSPLLFNKTLDMTLLFNCFYLGIFCANYAYVSFTVTNGWIYFIFTFVPPLLNFVISGNVIKTMSILNAISELDGEVVGRVIDETEVRREPRAKRATSRERSELVSTGVCVAAGPLRSQPFALT